MSRYLKSYPFLAACLTASLSVAAPAQVTDTAAARTAPHRLTISGAVRPAHWRYAVEVDTAGSDSVAVVSLGERDVTVSSAEYGKVRAWLVVSTGGRGTLESTDSLWLDSTSLRPLRWTSILGYSRMAAEFTGDSVYVGMSGPASRRSATLGTPADLITGGEMLTVLLPQLPLAEGWSDSAHVIALDLGGGQVLPATLTVEREDTTTVSGSASDSTAKVKFGAWVVALRGGRADALFWVSPATGLVVRGEQAMPFPGKGTVRWRLLPAP